MGIITRGPFTQSDGLVEVDLGFQINFQWHEITVSVFDAAGDPGTGVTGTLAGQVRKRGADQIEVFTETLDLAAGDRSWLPELSVAEIFQFTPTGFNATFTYFISVNSWGFA
jgi:hypothetical protein